MTDLLFEPYIISGGKFIVPEDLTGLLLHCEKYNFSDLHLQTGNIAHMDAEGKKHVVLDHALSNGEMEDIINQLYRRSSASGLISKGQPVDGAYDMSPSRGERYRYRFNGSGELSIGGASGMQITIRALPADPPTASQLGLVQDDIDDFIHDNGLVVISGQTGSGKTSTLAAVVRYVLEEMPHRKLLTAEAPIEFVFDSVAKNMTMISQSEVGVHIESFSAALRSALRRKPEIYMVGEARDLETIDAAIEAAVTGHLVWTTNHANGAPETMQRMVMVYPHEVQSLKLFMLCSIMRACISQTLVIGTNGKRVALREKLLITPEVREVLTSRPPLELLSSTRDALINYGRPMIVDAQEKYDAGIIDDAELTRIARTYGEKTR